MAKTAVPYGSEIPNGKANTVANMKILKLTRRPFLSAVVRTYRTIPAAALNVLGDIAPWLIEAKTIYDEHWRKIENINKDISRAQGLARLI